MRPAAETPSVTRCMPWQRRSPRLHRLNCIYPFDTHASPSGCVPRPLRQFPIKALAI